ncbi:MAG: DUF2079 domain-containing protein [Acidimicrobiia bacterium]
MTTPTESAPWLRRNASAIAASSVGVVATVFAITFGTLGLRHFWRFHVHVFDVGIFAQGTWLLSRLKWPFFVTIRGLPLFADHSSYILVLIAPIYWLFPSPATLIVIGVIALAITGPLAFLVARRAGAGLVLSTATGVLVLFQPALQWQVRDSFHPEILVIPLVVAAIALLQKDRDGWAVVAFVIALTAKEDVGLLIAPLGLVIWWVMGKKRTGLSVAGLGVGAFLLNFLVLLPAWSPSGELLYSYRYAALGEGPLGIVAGLLTKPDVWIEVWSDPLRLGYVAALLLALPLALLSPRWLLVGVPTLLANVFTNHGYQYDVRYHYTAYLIAVVVVAACFGAARVQRSSVKNAVWIALAVMIVSGFTTWFAVAPVRETWAPPHEHQDQIREILDQIPDDAAVSAWTTFGAHLTEREFVYLFPNPFSEHYYATPGPYGTNGGDIPDPALLDYVFVRTDSYSLHDALIAELWTSDDWAVEVNDPPFLLLRSVDR